MAAGVLLMQLAIWVGAFVRALMPYNHWTSFPAFCTTVTVFVIGVAVLIYAIVELKFVDKTTQG